MIGIVKYPPKNIKIFLTIKRNKLSLGFMTILIFVEIKINGIVNPIIRSKLK